ncbi:hypothetical protein AYO20_03184 [Fonsecaea nubica]|uniref:RWD domain-containing protein n=1 Tax=Fonsecaea nubica TaxID=856822 RepID=A0A178D7P1_9EURO|nr:hypothetical protein AYO20_03184 [Fonsecaea nubica]OAL37677.1 hypothetical protein AYO20_03184 [Fonsecaea nubica]
MASSPSSPKTFTSPPSETETSSPQNTMPTRDRSAGRNVHIYDLNNPTTVIGGLLLLPGVTNANFYTMIEIIIIFEGPFFLQNENETTIERDDHPLQPGKYYIVTTSSFQLNNEPWLVRTISLATGSRVATFTEAIRSRDRQCIISGDPVPTFNGMSFWEKFEAAHIFPLAYEGHWGKHDYSRWITIQPEKGGSINSVQNGLLLRRDIHSLFDAYLIAINPDDNYKVVAFGPTGENIEGKHLDRESFTRPDAPIDPLLRWHFRQAVLANMRGAGEPRFEHDLPPGSDIVGEILRGPKSGERMEFELFSRLGAQMELYPSAGGIIVVLTGSLLNSTTASRGAWAVVCSLWAVGCELWAVGNKLSHCHESFEDTTCDEHITYCMGCSLADEIYALNAIYGEGQFAATYSDAHHTTVSMRLPGLSYSFLLHVLDDYPQSPPKVLGVDNLVESLKQEVQQNAVYLGACVQAVHSSESVCLYDAIEEFQNVYTVLQAHTRQSRDPREDAQLNSAKRAIILKDLAARTRAKASAGGHESITTDSRFDVVDCVVYGARNMFKTRSEIKCCGQSVPLKVIREHGGLDAEAVDVLAHWLEEVHAPNPVYCPWEDCLAHIPSFWVKGDYVKCPFYLGEERTDLRLWILSTT